MADKLRVPRTRPVTNIGENATLSFEADEYGRGPKVYVGSVVDIRDIGANADRASTASNPYPTANKGSNNNDISQRNIRILGNPKGTVTLGTQARIIAADQYAHASIGLPPIRVENPPKAEPSDSQGEAEQDFYVPPGDTKATVYPQTTLYDKIPGGMTVGNANIVAATTATLVNQPIGAISAPTTYYRVPAEAERDLNMYQGARFNSRVLGENIAAAAIMEVNHIPEESGQHISPAATVMKPKLVVDESRAIH